MGVATRIDFDNISTFTGMTKTDILDTLEAYNMIDKKDIGTSVILYSAKMAENYFKTKKTALRPHLKYLKWNPPKPTKNTDEVEMNE